MEDVEYTVKLTQSLGSFDKPIPLIPLPGPGKSIIIIKMNSSEITYKIVSTEDSVSSL